MEKRSRAGAPTPPRIPVGTSAGRRANTLTFLGALIGGLAQGWALINVGRALGAVLPALSAATGHGTRNLASRAGTPGPDQTVTGYLVTALGCALVAAACQLAVELLARSSMAEQEGAIRAKALGHLFRLGPARATSTRSGSRVSLLTDGAERVAAYRQTFLAPTLAAAATPAAVLILLALTVDWLTGLVLLVAVLLIPPFILAVYKKVRRSGSGSRQARTRLSAEYLDAIQGLTTLSLARAARRTLASLRAEGERNRRAVMRLLAGNQLVIFLTDSLFSLFFVTAAAGLALSRLASGALTLGDALGIVLVSYVLLEPLDHVGAFFYVAMGGLAHQRALRRLLATSPGGSASPASPDERQAGLPSEPGDAVVELEAVSARWEPSGPAVLTDVNLTVRPGERLAVVGPSGAGKSTLVSLLAGDLLPASGSVRVAGTLASPASQEQVRAASAVVAQTTWLLTGTIADNLRLADPEASEERMWQALQAAGLAEEVRAMPAGLNTALGEQGLGLSGGQAQRVALARAFLADRPLLILDEPTSQVDLDSEAAIVAAMERVSQGRTVVTISHRAGMIAGTDRVLRVSDAHVSEE